MPVITLNSVVLPAPFGPMIALRSPAMIWRVTSRTACKPSNLLPRPFNSRTGTLPFARLPVLTLVVLWFEKVVGVRCANPGAASLFAELAGREAVAVDRLSEDLVLPVRPELADVRIGLD